MTLRRSARVLFVVVILLVLLIPVKIVVVHLACHGVTSAPVERLWTSAAPGALGTTDADQPSVAVFLPAKTIVRTPPGKLHDRPLNGLGRLQGLRSAIEVG